MGTRKIYTQGTKFGSLTYLEDAEAKVFPNGGIKRMARMRCACGYEGVFQLANVTSGNSKQCENCRMESLRQKAAKHMGGDAVNRKQCLQAYKRNAAKRSLEFTLTKEQFDKLIEQNCFYCGIEPSNVYALRKSPSDPVVYSGIDRVDSNIGYTPDNCVPCCRQCNMAKSNRPISEFTSWLDRIQTHSLQWRNQSASNPP